MPSIDDALLRDLVAWIDALSSARAVGPGQARLLLQQAEPQQSGPNGR